MKAQHLDTEAGVPPTQRSGDDASATRAKAKKARPAVPLNRRGEPIRARPPVATPPVDDQPKLSLRLADIAALSSELAASLVGATQVPMAYPTRAFALIEAMLAGHALDALASTTRRPVVIEFGDKGYVVRVGKGKSSRHDGLLEALLPQLSRHKVAHRVGSLLPSMRERCHPTAPKKDEPAPPIEVVGKQRSGRG